MEVTFLCHDERVSVECLPEMKCIERCVSNFEQLFNLEDVAGVDSEVSYFFSSLLDWM